MATTTADKRGSPPLSVTNIILLIVALGGIGVAWGLQLVQGMQVTGLSQEVVWGLYIAAFFTAAGAGAGLLALVGVGEFRPVLASAYRFPALIMTLVSFIAAGLLIAMDLGSPLRLWRIATAFRLNSFLTLDFWALTLAGIFTLLYLWSVSQSNRSRPLLGALAVFIAAALVLMEGWLLATLAAHPLWTGGLTVFSFVLSSLVGGLALGLLLLGTPTPLLRFTLAASLVLTLLLVLSEVLTPLLGGTPREVAEVNQLLTGTAAIPFWGHLLIGVVLPLVLLFVDALPRVVSALALLGILAEKSWMLVAGQAEPWLALPTGSYAPAIIEFVAIVGVVALALLIFRLLSTAWRPEPEAT